MAYTLAEAAKACGRGKSTIHKAITTGQLSAEKGPNGAYAIDGAELARVFPPKPRNVPEPSPWEASGRQETAGDGAELAMLRKAVELLERERVTQQETVADLRKRLDRAEERVLALEDRTERQPVQPAPEPPAVVEELRRRLEESEAQIRALVTAAPPTPQAAQERPGEGPPRVALAALVRGSLGRLWRRP